MGSEISIVNQTEQDINICLRQVGPLYYENNVAPKQEVKWTVGKVWFTIEAKISTPDNCYTPLQVVQPIALWTGAAICAAFIAVPLMIGAAPATAAAATAAASTEGAAAAATGGTAAAATGGTATAAIRGGVADVITSLVAKLNSTVPPDAAANLAHDAFRESKQQWETLACRENGVYMGSDRRYAICDAKGTETVEHALKIVEIT